MHQLRPIERAFFNEYLSRLPAGRRPRRPIITASYAGARGVTDALIRLYLDGRKTAGSSLAKDFSTAGDPMPKRGDYWIILDSRRRPRCLVRTVRVERNRFGAVPDSVALAEGEGDMSVAHWKRVHRRAYGPYLSKWGIHDLDSAMVLTEHFELLHADDEGVGRVGNLARVPGRFIDDPEFRSLMSTKRLGAAAGSERLYVNIDRVKPGGKSVKYHSHSRQEEFFLILRGSGKLRLNGRTLRVKTGDFFAKPAGRGIAHQFINDGRTVLEILDCGTNDRGDVVRYPDEGVVLNRDRRSARKGRRKIPGWSSDPNG